MDLRYLGYEWACLAMNKGCVCAVSTNCHVISTNIWGLEGSIIKMSMNMNMSVDENTDLANLI